MKRIIILTILLFLSCSKQLIKENTPQKAERKSNNPAIYIIKESVNLRSRPTVNSSIVKELKDGSRLELIKNSGGWYYIKDEENTSGWIRSDLAGPKKLSRTLSASAFIDSTMPAYNTKMFFDSHQLYKIIYLIFPRQEYNDANKLLAKAKKIALKYQKEVYPGALEIRIMNPDEKTLFRKLKIKAYAIADYPIPIIRFGRLIDLSVTPKNELMIKIAAPDSIPNGDLLKMAKNISKIYDYRIEKIEILIADDSMDGIKFLQKPLKQKNSPLCRLYYLEDANGEFYKFNQCFE
jgi:uncharacterized protein YgiM (DUF1202 family)